MLASTFFVALTIICLIMIVGALLIALKYREEPNVVVFCFGIVFIVFMASLAFGGNAINAIKEEQKVKCS